ncbi:MAG: hypothetical protein GY794_00360 [bacterium]|nr:hypothetical protein [bacterium]
MQRHNAFVIIAVGVFYAVLVGPAAGDTTTRPAIDVTNFTSGQTVRFPVVLICGKLVDEKLEAVEVTSGSSKWSGLASDGRFKVLVELATGGNKLAITAGRATVTLTLNYKPQTNPYVLRVHYFVGKSGDTRFQTPLKNDPQNWKGKLDTAMKLMQTFTAHRLDALGLGYRTFNLELDQRGRVKVHILTGSRSVKYYQGLTGDQLYAEAEKEIAKQSPHKRARDLVIPAFTYFDPKTGMVVAHTALSDGRMALFGGGGLFSWPDNIADAQAAFMNPAPVDPRVIFSDSKGRHTFWANASTTMGAALHEVGHTFALPHSRDALGIMTRGNDHLNRFFTLVEPPHARKKKLLKFKDSEIARWSPVSAGALGPNRFFAMDDRKWKARERIIVRLDRTAGQVVIASPYGLRYIGLWCVSPTGETQSITPALISKRREMSTKVAIPLDELKKRFGDIKFKFRIIDDEGMSRTVLLSDLLEQADKPSTPK